MSVVDRPNRYALRVGFAAERVDAAHPHADASSMQLGTSGE